jgi:hypothetical protein
MTQPRPSGPDNRQWNLGKGRTTSGQSASAPVEPKPEPPKPAPATEKVLDAILGEQDSRPPIGRAVPESKGIRGLLNHPLTLAGTGLVLVIALVYLVMGGSLAGLFGGSSGKYVPAPTAEERAESLRESLQSQETALVANGRLLVMGGQILEAAGTFMSTPMGSQTGAEERYEFIPDHLKRLQAQAPPPTSPDFVKFRLEWDNQATASIEMGQQVIRLARENNISAATLRDLGARLRSEGMAILDVNLEGDARRGVSGIEGARARLAAGTNLIDRDEADPLLARLLANPLGLMILAARPPDDYTPVRPSEETPQP